MKKEIRELYPNWIDNIDGKKYTAGFTADMDGLLCASFAKHHLGLEVNAFYNFKKMCKINPTDKRELIFFDSALKEGKVFDNHLTKGAERAYVNPESANINSVLGNHRGEYTDKFAMSTFIQLYALYNIPLPTTLQGKLILLCVDVGFKGYYDSRYKSTFLSYLEMFGMMELVDVLEQFTQQQMYEFMLRAKMNMSIQHMSNNKLFINTDLGGYNADWFNFETGMDLDWYSKHLGFPVELPQEKFEVVEEFTTKTLDAYMFNNKQEEQAVSYAYINSKKIMVSFRKENQL